MYGEQNQTNNLPSEQYRLAGEDWAKKDAAARILEETKTAVLSQRMSALGDMPYSHAERKVKSTDEWQEHLTKMVDARKAANLAKVKMEFMRMKFSEWQSLNASRRAEMRLTG